MNREERSVGDVKLEYVEKISNALLDPES